MYISLFCALFHCAMFSFLLFSSQRALLVQVQEKLAWVRMQRFTVLFRRRNFNFSSTYFEVINTSL